MKLGNEVLRVDSPAGTLCPHTVIMLNPLRVEEIGKRLKLPSTVTQWTNDDPHYPRETGCSAGISNHAIAGPMRFSAP